MKDVNTLMKLKALGGLRQHMDSRMSERLRPKRPPVSAPQAPTQTGAGEAPGITTQSGLPQDDEQRLMDLYSSLK